MKKKSLKEKLVTGCIILTIFFTTKSSIAQNANALNFDGTDDYVNAGQNFDFSVKDAFTVEGWIKAPNAIPNGSSTGISQIVSKLDDQFRGWGFQILPNNFMHKGELSVYLSSVVSSV